ncbi:MAG: EamA family transporter [Saprospiraceae bacterium]|nr:EamA family transporter [Saprospiraceae bacterium]
MKNKALPTLVWIAFATLCIVWGTTYLGVKIAVEYFPPFFFSGFRHGAAGLIFIVLYLTQSRQMPSWTDIKRASLAGIFMITGGNAFLSWGMKYIPSGLAGVLSATAPVFITLLSIYSFPNFKITWKITLGLLLGFIGIALISKPEGGIELTYDFWIGFTLAIVANLFWGIGSVYMKKKPVEQHPFLKTGIQMIPASLINFAISFIFEPSPNFAAIDLRGWEAILYLIFIGSLVGYLSFVYLTKYMTPARLSIHIYVNTVVAVLVGWMLGGEHLTVITWSALGIIMCGVFVVNNEYARMSNRV